MCCRYDHPSPGVGGPARPDAPPVMNAIPALIFSDPETAGIEVAALSLLDRLLVALQRAGCGPITIVSPGPLPRLRRAPALGIAFRVVAEAPSLQAPALLAAASVLVEARDVREVIRRGGRLATAEGDALPLGIASAWRGDFGQAFAGGMPVRAHGVAMAVTNPAAAGRAAARLWQSLASATDGWVDRHLNRPLGRPLSQLLTRTAVTPNQVTLLATVIGFLGAWCFGQGTYAGGVLGALLFQASALLDCVDGELARVLFKESRAGKWLDLWLDQAVHLAVFAAVPLGLWRGGAGPAVLWLGLSGLVGALLAFAVVLRRMRDGAERDEPLDRLIRATTNRDFSLLLICLALLGRLEWFLWIMGTLVHVFWIIAWRLSLPAPAARRTGPA
jgi:phosphatidylglycerophosphate synthase